MRTFGFPEFLFILEAARWTLALSLIAFVGGAIGGLVVALSRTATSPWLRSVSTGLHPDLPGHAAAAAAVPDLLRRAGARAATSIRGSPPGVALILNSSAFLGEIWRGCIEAIPRGQWEAAEALEPEVPARMRDVILPQALQDRAGADGRLHGADHQGHVAGRDHRLHRGHARRPDHQQRHLPAADRLQRWWRRSTSCCAGRCRCWPRAWSAARPGARRELQFSRTSCRFRQPLAGQTSCRQSRFAVFHESIVNHADFRRFLLIGDTSDDRCTARRAAIAALGLGAALTVFAPFASAQTVDDIKKKGELTVGLLVDFPPYGTTNAQNQPDGYDADVARCWPRTGA